MSGDAAPDNTAPRLTTLLRYARPFKLFALIAVLGMALEAGVASAFTYLMKTMLDDVFVARNESVTRWLPWIILLLFALRAVGVYVGDFFAAKMSRGIVRDARAKLFDRYLLLPSKFFTENSAGPLISRLTNEVEQLGHACVEGFKISIADSLLLLGCLVVMLVTSVKLTLAVLLIGPVIGWVVGHVAKRFRRLNQNIQTSVGEITQLAHTAIHGERDIKIFGADALEAQRFRAINDHNYRQQLKITRTNALSTSLVQFLAALALALVIFVAARPGLVGTTLSAGEFMSFISAMLITLPSLKRLTNVQNILSRGATAAHSIERIIAEAQEIDEGTLVRPKVAGKIEFRGVSLHYRQDSQALVALDNVNLTLLPGTVTALVGRSGGGKSTLASLIPRLQQPSAGQILLDDIALNDYALKNLRTHIAWVGQQLVLNGLSVLDNVAYGDAKPDRARAEQALRQAQAYDFVQAMPAGMDSAIGQQGAQLSGGQRQRLAIARALYKRAAILVLDEATSALDNDAERAVQQALSALRAQCTTLVIAHRLSTVEGADNIVVLDQGRIVEQGSHAALMARGGHYAELYARGLASAAA
jgi:ATP-binding cassette, subfamily B, bacterial MsbA